MSRVAISLVFSIAVACQAAPPPSKAEQDAGKTAPATAPVQAPAPASAPGPASEPPPGSAPAAPGPAPAWFDPAAFEHAAIIRQDLTGTPVVSGQTSAMILLELQPGTTAEQCIERARTKLGESISDLPATSTTPQGYLQMQGKHDTYEYTVVCGVAKAKPTMFLSYTQ